MTLRHPFDWLRSRRASAAMESAIAISFLGVSLGSISQIVQDRLQEDLLERAAYAVTRATVLEAEAAASEQALRMRALAAIQRELGDKLDPELLEIQIDAYDSACEMSRGVESSSTVAQLGGEGSDLVAIRIGYARPDGSPSNRLQKIALGRNEPRGEVTQDEIVGGESADGESGGGESADGESGGGGT